MWIKKVKKQKWWTKWNELKIIWVHWSIGKGFLCYYVVELLFWHKAISVCVGSLNHLLKLWFVNGFSQFLCHSSQVLYWNESGFFIVEQVKYFPAVFSWILVWNSCSHQCQELFEVDLSWSICVQVSNHLINGLVFGLEAEWCHGGLEF